MNRRDRRAYERAQRLGRDIGEVTSTAYRRHPAIKRGGNVEGQRMTGRLTEEEKEGLANANTTSPDAQHVNTSITGEHPSRN